MTSVTKAVGCAILLVKERNVVFNVYNIKKILLKKFWERDVAPW